VTNQVPPLRGTVGRLEYATEFTEQLVLGPTDALLGQADADFHWELRTTGGVGHHIGAVNSHNSTPLSATAYFPIHVPPASRITRVRVHASRVATSAMAARLWRGTVNFDTPALGSTQELAAATATGTSNIFVTLDVNTVVTGAETLAALVTLTCPPNTSTSDRIYGVQVQYERRRV
jgi:hypothetical protein